MRFVINLNEETELTFKRDVQFLQPTDSGGSKQMKFRAQFAELTTDEIRAITDEADDEGEATEALLKRVFIGFEDVTDEEGKKVDFSDSVRDMLINRPYIRVALVQSYMRALSGNETKDRKTKN